MLTGEGHRLLLEILYVGTFAEELGHVVDLVARLAGEHVACAREDGGADEDRHIGEFADEFLHEREVLRAVVLGGNMYLEERNVDIAQVIIIALGGIADEELTIGIVVFQPILEGSTDKAASDNTDVYHDFKLTFRLLLVALKNIAGVDLVLHVVEAGVISVGNDGLRLGFELGQVINDEAAEETGAVFKGGLVDDDMRTFGLDALHHTLDGRLTKVVTIGFHR